MKNNQLKLPTTNMAAAIQVFFSAQQQRRQSRYSRWMPSNMTNLCRVTSGMRMRSHHEAATEYVAKPSTWPPDFNMAASLYIVLQ